MKKSVVVMLLAGLLAGGVFAQNAGRPQTDPVAANAQVSTLTGTVTLESGQPEIKANGKTWYIQAPLRSIVFLPWKEGVAVSVTGYALESRKLGNGVTVSDRIVATSITLAGKTYEIPRMGLGRGMDCDDEDGRMGGNGRMGGMGGGRGRN